MRANLHLYEAPVLIVHVGGEEITLSMAKTDTPKGHKDTMVHINRIEGFMKSEDFDQALEAIRLWMIYLFGQQGYDRVFSTPDARGNFTWHKALYTNMVSALSRSQEGFLQSVLEIPALLEIKTELAQSLADALEEGSEHAGASGDHSH